MSWKAALDRKIFSTHAEEELKAFLYSQLPTFKAPTRPAQWRKEILRLRRRALEEVFLRGIPRAVSDKKPRVVWGETLTPDPSFIIRKLRYEIYPDYWIPALLYEPTHLRGKAPVVLNPDGHHAGGKAAKYKQVRCANLARRGMLALAMEFIGMGELAGDRPHSNIAHLNLTGFAGVGLFYLALKKGLDVLLAHRCADPKRVAVTGVSGGGWQTIVISALDPRVTACVPVAGYTSIRARVNVPADMGDLEQTAVDMTTVLDYQDMTAMLAPRPALLIQNENDDCCFATARTKPVIYDAVMPTYRAFGAESVFETYSNKVPGTHNYEADNRSQFYRFLNRHFGLNSPGHDIHRESDIFPATRLNVGLPLEQENMLTVARKRARVLAAKRRVPKTAAQRRQLRAAIAKCIRLPQYAVGDTETCRTGDMSLHILSAGPWSIPCTAWNPPTATEAEIRLCDKDRTYWKDSAPDQKRHVYALDIFGTGENATPSNLQMLVECAGRRLLGIEVAQILACADFAARQTGNRRIHVLAMGTKMCFAGLVAAALRPDRFASLTSWSMLNTMDQVIEGRERYEETPPLFCFGLLKLADVRELIALLEDVVYYQPAFALPPETGYKR